MSNAFPYVINDRCLTIMADNKPVVVPRTDKTFDKVVDAIKDKDWDLALELADRVGQVESFVKGDLEVRGNTVFYIGEEVHGHVVNRILDFIHEGLDAAPLLAFLKKLMENTSKRCIDDLFSFLEHGNMPVDPDGDFYAYKAVRPDWTDKHTGTLDNKIGSVVSVPRNKVDDNPDHACSHGLHAGSIQYVQGFARDGDKIIIVKIDPGNVVSVPSHDTSKLRCCEYKVTGEYTDLLPNTTYDYDWEDDLEDDVEIW